MEKNNNYYTLKIKKKTVKIISVALALCIVALVALFIFHFSSTMTISGTFKYAQNHSETESSDFIPYYSKYEQYIFQVSQDPENNNEVHIFTYKNTPVLENLGLSGKRYTHYMNVTSPKTVGSLYIEITEHFDEQKHLLYYSNNKDRITSCKYQIKDEEGNVYDKTETIATGQGFAFTIPCITNHGNNKYEVLKASFYDIDGNLVYEHTPKN